MDSTKDQLIRVTVLRTENKSGCSVCLTMQEKDLPFNCRFNLLHSIQTAVDSAAEQETVSHTHIPSHSSQDLI